MGPARHGKEGAVTGLCLTRRKKFATDAESEPKTGRVPCYVCGVLVSRKKGVDIGHNLFRHKRCRAGTKRWLENNHGDPFCRYFAGKSGMAATAGEEGMANGIRPMRDGDAAVAYGGPELDDYLRVREAKHRFGKAGNASGQHGHGEVAADDAGHEEARAL